MAKMHRITALGVVWRRGRAGLAAAEANGRGESKETFAMKPLPRAMMASAVLACALGGATTSKADTLYWTVPIGSSTPNLLDSNQAPMGGSVSTGPYWIYTSFTLTENSYVTDFTYYSYYMSDYLSTNWAIVPETSGPPTPVETYFTTTGQHTPSPGGGPDEGGPDLVNVPIGDTLLDAGTYWLAINVNLTSSASGWSATYATGTSFGCLGGDCTGSLGAYLAPTDGEPIQPIAAAAFFVDGAQAPNVPEASTWAMMLLGFAGLGLAARQRLARPRAA